MNKIRIIPLLLVLTAVVLTACAPKEPAPEARPKGYLFIVGGGDRDEPLMRRYVDLSRRNGPAKIVIFTMASGVPLETVPGSWPSSRATASKMRLTSTCPARRPFLPHPLECVRGGGAA